MAFCGNCGCKNPEINRFCLNCGAQLYYSYEQYLDANGKPITGEIERIGGVPNQAPPAPVVNPQPAPQNTQPYQQPQEQPAPPVFVPLPQEQYQQPPQQYGQPQYQQPAYQQPAPQQQVNQPPYQPYQPIYQDQAPAENEQPEKKKLFTLSNGEPMAPMEFLPGCPDNNKKFRMIGMGVAVVSFIFIIVGLVAIQISGGGESLGSILSIGLGDGGTVILVFAIITILVALIAILIPIFSVISGISLIASLCLILMNTARYPSVSMSSIIIIAVIAVLAIGVGIVASTLMAKYARSNVRNITLMQCSVVSWLGVNKLGGNSQ